MNKDFRPPSNPDQVYSDYNIKYKFEDARDLPSITLYKIIIVLLLILSGFILSPKISRIVEYHLNNSILNQQLEKVNKELLESKTSLSYTNNKNFLDKTARENGFHKKDEIAVILPEESISTKGDETIEKYSLKQTPWYLQLYNEYKLQNKP